jgi:hypothetical protein
LSFERAEIFIGRMTNQVRHFFIDAQSKTFGFSESHFRFLYFSGTCLTVVGTWEYKAMLRKPNWKGILDG